jgi:hypothetical protein
MKKIDTLPKDKKRKTPDLPTVPMLSALGSEEGRAQIMKKMIEVFEEEDRLESRLKEVKAEKGNLQKMFPSVFHSIHSFYKSSPAPKKKKEEDEGKPIKDDSSFLMDLEKKEEKASRKQDKKSRKERLEQKLRKEISEKFERERLQGMNVSMTSSTASSAESSKYGTI